MSTDQWKKENTKVYLVRVLLKSGIPAAVKAYAEDHNMTEPGVCVAAVKEKLEREGYWKPQKLDEEEE